MQALPGIPLPLIQAPMAGVQDAALAAAACNAGALGSLPCAMLDPAGIEQAIETLREATDAPFNLNFFAHRETPLTAAADARWAARLAPYYAEFGLDPAAPVKAAARVPFNDAACRVVENLRPAVVSFHFGLPEDALLARVRASGARVLASATTVAEARWLEARGVDAVIAQGLEAGGHRGHFLSPDLSLQPGTFALLPAIVNAIRLPVIAAGGIADAAGVAAAFVLGASAVQIGTAYLCCHEAKTGALHRARLLAGVATDTALTNVFSGRPARGLVNRCLTELGPLADDVPAFPHAAARLAPLRAAAEAAGLDDFSPLWAGQNTAGCAAVGAAEITAQLARGLPD